MTQFHETNCHRNLLVILGVQGDLELVVIVADPGVRQPVRPGLLALAVDWARARARDCRVLLHPGGDGEALPGRGHCQHPLLGELAGNLLWLDPAGQGEALLELFGDVGVSALRLGRMFSQDDQNISLGLYAQLLKWVLCMMGGMLFCEPDTLVKFICCNIQICDGMSMVMVCWRQTMGHQHYHNWQIGEAEGWD